MQPRSPPSSGSSFGSSVAERSLEIKPSLAILILGLASAPAFGDAYQSLANQRNMLPGGRAALLGGAFTAVAADSSASFYNPAGLALIKGNRFDLTATSYASSALTYHEAVNEEAFNERSEVTYPSFVGATTRLGPMTLGYSYMTLDAHNIYQQDRYANISTEDGAVHTYSRTYQERSAYIFGGGSAALSLTDSLSVGLSLFYYQRNLENSTHELVQLNGGGLVAINSTMNSLNTGAAGVYGVLWRRPSYSIGASVRLGRSLSDRSVLLSDTVAFDPEAPATNDANQPVPGVVNVTRQAQELDELNPSTYTLGAAFHPGRWLLVAADVLLHEGTKSLHKDLGGADLQTTVNASFGVGQRLGPVELLVGYFTNNSMYRAPRAGVANQPIHIDYTGHTGGVGLDLGGFQGHVGVVRQRGQGQAQIRNDDLSVQAVDGEVTTYLISGNLAL